MDTYLTSNTMGDSRWVKDKCVRGGMGGVLEEKFSECIYVLGAGTDF